MSVGKKVSLVTVAALASNLTIGENFAHAASTGPIKADKVLSTLFPVKQDLFEKGKYTKGSTVECEFKQGQLYVDFSYTTGNKYYNNGFFAGKTEAEMTRKARQCGYNMKPADTDTCSTTKAGKTQSMTVGIFNKPLPTPTSITRDPC